MTDAAISVERLGKTYMIGHNRQREPYTSLRDVLASNAQRLARKTRDMLAGRAIVSGDEVEEFWALKDVSFEVNQGQRLGIIGRNGAGKSTLLKLLSRITEPSEGRIRTKGRVASLLEVGTGFHPELTGRENIFLNGAILGMGRREIRRKLDEIVDFAGVEAFLDTPVKRYSSGMYVRLAFSVAAHLEPEILIVDEVLAVGDGEFQKKSLGKIEDVSKNGRTVLFVSHNMGMISALCDTCMLLESGHLVDLGETSSIILNYFRRGGQSPHAVDFRGASRKVGDDVASLLEAHIEDMAGNTISEIDFRSDLKICMRYTVHKSLQNPPFPNFHIYDSLDNYFFTTNPSKSSLSNVPGEYYCECIVPGFTFNSGVYFVGLALTSMNNGTFVSFFERHALAFNVFEPILETLDDLRCGYSGPIPGISRPSLKWRIDRS